MARPPTPDFPEARALSAPSQHASAAQRLVVDVEGARDIGPSEAAGLVRECLALALKHYDSALGRALLEIESPVPGAGGTQAARDADVEPLPVKIARIVRRDHDKVGPRFRAEFDRLFQDRRNGVPRKRDPRGAPATALALVDESDHTGQVALKNAVQAMQSAAREVGFGFDLRTRMIMREEATSGEYDNPWGATLLCDALGNTCRGLWGTDDVWRPIMERLVGALTPTLLAVQKEMDALLQDRDVLPVLKVRTRKRGAPPADAAEAGDLFSRLAQTYGEAAANASAPVVSRSPAQPYLLQQWKNPAPNSGGDALDFGNAGGWHVGEPAPAAAAPAGSAWHVLERALALLQQTSAGATDATVPAPRAVPAFDPALLGEGEHNVLPIVDAAVAASGDAPLPRPVVDVVSAALDEVFDNPYLPSAIKIVFGRLQIPILKAALRDREVLSDPRHPARRFFDTLAASGLGARPEVPNDALFIALVGHLATVVRDAPEDQAPFVRALEELDHFLDAERAAYNQKLAQALPSLLALDAEADARARARIAVAVRTGARAVPPEVRDFLDREVVDRVTLAYLSDGQGTASAAQTFDFADELLWSIAPEHGPAARKRLLPLIPRLVRTIGEWWPQDDADRARRKVFLARLYELHMAALQATTDLPPPEEDSEGTPSRARVPIPDSPPPAERDEAADTVESLLRGDWVAFIDDDGSPLLAKYAWRSPHGLQLLFTHRDGSIALIHTPATLADALRGGQAKVAVEAVPVFERAMEKLLNVRALHAG